MAGKAAQSNNSMTCLVFIYQLSVTERWPVVGELKVKHKGFRRKRQDCWILLDIRQSVCTTTLVHFTCEAGFMIFGVQPDGPLPIYEQIVAQVIYGVAAGILEVGTFIPSVRELAEQLMVHPNTVARAFQELERAGVVTARRGRGMEVTEKAPAACQARRQELVRERIRQALREAVASVLAPEEIRRLVEEELAAVNGVSKPKGTR